MFFIIITVVLILQGQAHVATDFAILDVELGGLYFSFSLEACFVYTANSFQDGLNGLCRASLVAPW